MRNNKKLMDKKSNLSTSPYLASCRVEGEMIEALEERIIKRQEIQDQEEIYDRSSLVKKLVTSSSNPCNGIYKKTYPSSRSSTCLLLNLLWRIKRNLSVRKITIHHTSSCSTHHVWKAWWIRLLSHWRGQITSKQDISKKNVHMYRRRMILTAKLEKHFSPSTSVDIVIVVS